MIPDFVILLTITLDCRALSVNPSTAAIAAITSDARTRGALINAGVSLTGLGLAIWGTTEVVDSITELGATKGGAQTITNSRIVSDSGNDNTGSSRISSSGETLNLGNVEAVNDSQAQGGLGARSFQTGSES